MGTPTPSFCPSCCSNLVSQHPSETASRCVTDKSDGRHRFVITDYRLTKGIGPGNDVTSRPFSVGGHDWAVKCYPEGDKSENAEFISLFLSLESDSVRSAESVRVVVFTLAMLDNVGRPSPPYRGGPITFSGHTSRWGLGRFIKRADLESTSYVAGDRLVIQCEVSVLRPPHSEDVPKIRFTTGPLAPPPYELHRHLDRLLDSGEGADVTFQVGEEFFAAHRCVLAARSPVFRAELYGPMEEAHIQLIKIEDVEPAVFDALLRFIYTESLPPPILEVLVKAKGPASTATARLLFAAADRYHVERLKLIYHVERLKLIYHVERLKLICEDKLCRDMDVDNVAGTFELAERHNCSSLKSACVKFITASPETLFAVIKLHGWMRLLQDETFSLVQKP